MILYDFLYAVISNFCSKTHRLATIHTSQTDNRRQTDDDMYM